MSVLSVRIDSELEKKLEYLMKNRKIIDKSAYIRQLLDKSIEIDLLDYLAEEVGKKHLSAWKAAQIADIPLTRMLDELASRNILTYDNESYLEDLEFLERGSS
ncbi:MAG: hypothetical protein ACFFCS_12900 [Candidatus Hodarchaeota archaeon]